MLILKRRWNFFLQVASHFPKTKPVTVTNVLLTCYIRITLLIQKISDLRSQDREKKSAQWKGERGKRGMDGWRMEGGREGKRATAYRTMTEAAMPGFYIGPHSCHKVIKLNFGSSITCLCHL